ncbi:MAG: DNA primase [Aquificae bacterium]|nr:DNA primase [Aquificota bacterium]
MSSDLEELRRELDIVDVVSQYIPLQRSGSNYKANCPFHPDRTPSFFVSPSRQIFKCFGCGVGGDAIKFVALYENKPYVEAAFELAKRYGKKLSLEKTSQEEKVLIALDRVSDFYREKLLKREEALNYLRERGIDGATLRRFSLGFSADTGELVKLLRREGLLEEYLKTKNLIHLGGDNYRDLFLRRVVVPVKSPSGRVLGFTGRRIKEENSPKYVNSPDGPTFKKGKLLFGLSETKDYVREEGHALLVEGVFDLLKLFSENLRNAVAPLGTALTEDQAQLLSRYTGRVYVLFDGDEAGRKAAQRAVPPLLSAGLSVHLVELPEGHDPDSFLREFGPKALKELIKKTPELFESLLSGGRENLEEKTRLFREYLSHLPDDVKRVALATEFHKKMKVPLETLLTPPKRREEKSLPFAYRVLLKGFLELRPKLSPEELNLPPRIRELCRRALSGEEEFLPPEVLSYESANLERQFWRTVERFSRKESPKYIREVRE